VCDVPGGRTTGFAAAGLAAAPAAMALTGGEDAPAREAAAMPSDSLVWES